MAKNIKVLVNTGNQETNKTFDIAQGNGKTANPTRIKAVKGARYHLEDPAAKNVGPENIRSKRVGKDLHVILEGNNEADLIIEGYYDDAMLTENNRGLYGRAEDGKMYEYIPEDPTLEGMPINLADGGRPVSQVLGGVQIGEAFELSGLVLAAAGGGFGALTAGAAAVGAAALAGGGGGGGGTAPAPTDTTAAALTSIKAAAENNTATSGNLAASVFTAAGITGVDANNLAAIQSALDSAAVNGEAADTKAEVQAIVDAYKAIKDNADTASTANATQAQYAAVGVTGIDNAAKTNLLGDAVDAKAFADVDTVPELQTLATAAAAVITGAAAGTAPNKAQLEALGITGVTDANLSAIQAAIASTADDGTGVDTLSELQAVANTGATNAANAAAALSAIAAAAQANSATDANVAISVFATAGVTGVSANNVAAIQSALNSAAVVGTSANTLVEVQAIVDAYNAVKANADGTANNNATNPTQAQYTAIGVTGVSTPEQTSLLGDVIDAKPFTAVDTVAEVQTLANAAAAVMTAAAGTAGGNGPTRAQLEALGITGVTDANLAEVQATIARTADDGIGVDTLAELQAVVTIGADAAAAAAAAAVAAALAAITAAAQADDASNTNVAAGVFATAGVTGVDSTNVAAIQSALNSAAVNGSATDTLVEIQNIVNAYNAIRENADGTANNFANNPTQAQYALIGVTGVNSAEKESLLGDAIDGKPFSAVDSVPEVQALADAAAAVIAGATSGTAPTQAQLNALGITGVTPANLAAVQAAIAANGSGAAGVDTLTELQTVVTNAAAAAAALDAIKTAAENNSAGTSPSVADFAIAGITGVDSTNFAAINSALNSAAVNGAAADTKPEVQAIVDAYNAIKANADGTAANYATNPTQAQYTAIGVTGVSTPEQTSLLGDVIDGKPFSAVDTVAEVQALADAAAAVMTGAAGGTAPTQTQLEALGITGVTPANLAAVVAAIAATTDNGTGVDTLGELQTVVTNAANAAAAAAALSAIAAAAQANDATNTNVPASVFATAGVTGVDANNIAAIQSALNDADVQSGQADTTAKVQAVVDAYNAIKANADTAGTNNATQAQYAAIGINGIDNAAKTSLLGDVVDTKAFADVDTVGELQDLATAAAAVITGAAAGTQPTKAQLEALGITGVTDANLSAIQAAIAATPDDGTGVDTLSELQAVANTGATNAANAAAIAAALSAIAAAAQANNASDANVATTVFATAGVTGVDANNVAAIQSALNSAAVVGTSAGTLGEVQAIVDAYNAIKANADTAGTNNATQAQYAAIGINGIDNAAKTSLLGDVVDTKAFADVDTVGELQDLATAAAAVITGAAAGTQPTKAQLEALGITGVTDANLSAIQAAIAATPDDGTGVDTLSELQAVANTGATNAANAAAIAAALSAIAAAAEGNTATSGNLAAGVFATAGVTGVDSTNLSAIQSALDSAVVNGIAADTTAEVQAIVDAYKVIKDNADTASTTNATAAQYTAVGVTGIDNTAKASLLGDVVDTKAFADVDTVDELQTLATAAAAVISGATAGGTTPTKAQLEALGITGVTTGNLAAVLAAIAATPDDGTGVDTLIKLQTLVSSINDAPTGANAAFTVLEDGIKTFAAADFGFADASDSPANTLSAVIITTLPTPGTLKLNGTDVTLNQSIAVANLGNLVFAPAANANGAAYATIGFKVQDNGGTANGGADTSTSANTLTFNVTAVNDAPIVANALADTTATATVAITNYVVPANAFSDVDNVILTYTATLADGSALSTVGLSFDATTRTVSGTPSAGTAGSTLSVKVTASDGSLSAFDTFDIVVAPVRSVIDLGTSGKLIAPVQVEGKWYYHWDLSGDGTRADAGSLNGGSDLVTHDVLDSIFKYDINSNLNPGTDTNDVYRYATINGVQLSLPTMNGNMPYALTGVNTAATNGGATNSSTYDELFAIWDNFPGAPTSWVSSGFYWSATNDAVSNHDAIYMVNGLNNGSTGAADNNGFYAALQVVAANAAPVLADTALTLTGVSAGAAAPVNGTTTGSDLVSTLVGGISDTDAGATKGIAITGVKSSGTLYYSVDGGANWKTASGLSDTNALLLAADSNTRVYYKANGTSGNITDAITFRAWDMTANITEGVYTSTAANGGKAQFSTATDTVSVVSTDPGIAQVQAAAMKLTVNGVNQTATTLFLTETNPSASTVPAGTTISFRGNDGSVIYSTVWSSGASWSFNYTATGLTSGQQLYGTLDYNGVSYRFNQGVQFNGTSAPTTTTYGSPLVLDLNGDGVQTLAMSEGVSFDLLNTGSKQTVGWVDKHDGLLAIDLNGDGQINSGAELFGNHTQLANGTLAKDGWAALTAMDTNGDGKVDAQDANFDKLRVWVDANSDGVTDAGELHTLAEAKVASINLHADSIQTMQNGNWLEGFSSFTSTDGVTHEMVDAWLQMAATGVKTLNNGESLDLSTVINLSLVTGVNMSADTAANTVKLTLADVLSVATDASIVNGVHKLTLTGDANDTVELDLSQWANTGTTVTEGDHTYAVYNASSAAAAQLLIDQHMVLANHA